MDKNNNCSCYGGAGFPYEEDEAAMAFPQEDENDEKVEETHHPDYVPYYD